MILLKLFGMWIFLVSMIGLFTNAIANSIDKKYQNICFLIILIIMIIALMTNLLQITIG